MHRESHVQRESHVHRESHVQRESHFDGIYEIRILMPYASAPLDSSCINLNGQMRATSP